VEAWPFIRPLYDDSVTLLFLWHPGQPWKYFARCEGIFEADLATQDECLFFSFSPFSVLAHRTKRLFFTDFFFFSDSKIRVFFFFFDVFLLSSCVRSVIPHQSRPSLFRSLFSSFPAGWNFDSWTFNFPRPPSWFRAPRAILYLFCFPYRTCEAIHLVPPNPLHPTPVMNSLSTKYPFPALSSLDFVFLRLSVCFVLEKGLLRTSVRS